MDIFSYLLGRKYKDSNTGSGSGANITSNIKIVDNKSSVLSSNHNKLCIVNENNDISKISVQKVNSGNGECQVLGDLSLNNYPVIKIKKYIYSITTSDIKKYDLETLALIMTYGYPGGTTYSYVVAQEYNNNIFIFLTTASNYTPKGVSYKFNPEDGTYINLNYSAKVDQYTTSVKYDKYIYFIGGYHYYDYSAYTYPVTRFDMEQEIGVDSGLPSTTIQGSYYPQYAVVVGDKIYTQNRINQYNDWYEYIIDIKNGTVTKSSWLGNSKASLLFSVGTNIYIFDGTENTYYIYDTLTKTKTTKTTTSGTLPVSIASYNDGNKFYCFYGKYREFTVNIDLNENEILIDSSKSNYEFNIISSENLSITTNINKIYIGNKNNLGEYADAYLYDETKTGWVNVNTGEVLS